MVLSLYLCHANVIETTQEKFMKASKLLVLTTNTEPKAVFIVKLSIEIFNVDTNKRWSANYNFFWIMRVINHLLKKTPNKNAFQ